MSKNRPEGWRTKVKDTIRLLVIARNGIRKADLNGSILGLMWDYMLGDDEIEEIIKEMLLDNEMGLLRIYMGKTEPEVIYTLQNSKIEVLNNYVID